MRLFRKFALVVGASCVSLAVADLSLGACGTSCAPCSINAGGLPDGDCGNGTYTDCAGCTCTKVKLRDGSYEGQCKP